MKRAADLALDWIFMDKGAQVVLWCADAENEGSRAAAVRLGFTHQVVLPNWITIRAISPWWCARSRTPTPTRVGTHCGYSMAASVFEDWEACWLMVPPYCRWAT